MSAAVVSAMEAPGLPDATPQLRALVAALGAGPAPCQGVGPEVFFASDTAEAERVCGRCPAVVECLAYARALDIRYGVWGGRPNGGRGERERRG